jgi:hypothetical protein
MRSIWDKYYSEAHAMIFVIDSADPDRLEEARATFGRKKKILHIYICVNVVIYVISWIIVSKRIGALARRAGRYSNCHHSKQTRFSGE